MIYSRDLTVKTNFHQISKTLSQKFLTSAKICQKDACCVLYLFYPGDLVTRTGEREIQPVYRRVAIDTF